MGYNILRLMIDSASALQHEVPTGQTVDKFLKTNQVAAEHVDANDMLYSLGSSFSYDPESELSKIKTKLFALNFSDDEFNPAELHVLEKSVPRLEQGRYLIQEGTVSSPGHLTMTWPSFWAQHVAEFMDWLGDKPTTE